MSKLDWKNMIDVYVTVISDNPVNDEDIVDKFSTAIKDVEIEEIGDEDVDERYYRVTFLQTGCCKYYPGCYTLSNGDPGYPDEYDFGDNEPYEDYDIREFVKEFNAKLKAEGIDAELDCDSVRTRFEFEY